MDYNRDPVTGLFIYMKCFDCGIESNAQAELLRRWLDGFHCPRCEKWLLPLHV